MKGYKFLYTVIAAALFIAALTVSAPAGVRAQSSTDGPQIIITWKVIGGSAPAAYSGKILPVQGAPLEASVAVLENGKFGALGSTNIYWYLDSNFLGGGAGAQSITFTAPGNNEYMSLDVEIPDYEGGLSNTAYIAMVDPKVAIVAPYPNGMFASSSVSLRAVPYFFNATDLDKLSFNWAVNGQAVSTQENPQILAVNLAGGAPAGYSLSVDLGVQESGNPYLAVGKSVTLTSVGQPAGQ